MNISPSAEKSASGLDPKAKEILEILSELPAINDGTPEAARALTDMQNPYDPKPKKMAKTYDLLIPGPESNLTIRIYEPETELPGPLPCLVFFHGGGFVIGSIKSHDAIASNLAAKAECIVVSVEYRLAPETKFPGAVDDTFMAFQWVINHANELGINARKVAVAGDSAGGCLAAVTAMQCRDRGIALPVLQLLIYPVTDLSSDSVSKLEFADGYYLTKAMMDWFKTLYLNHNSEQTNPRVSPLLAKSHNNLPPARIITAGFDVLRDEGKAYADKLVSSGIDVVHSCYTDMFHGFLSFSGLLAQGQAALDECTDALRNAFYNR